MSDTTDDYDELYDEVSQRQEDLELEYGTESEYAEVKINEILRDEYDDPKYKQVLEDLGVNLEDTKLNLNNEDKKDSWLSDTDNKEKSNILNTLLKSKHVFKTDRRLRGWVEINEDKYERKTFNLLPSNDIIFILQFLDANYSTPSITGKLDRHVLEFDDNMNKQLKNFIYVLEDYPDHIVSRSEMKKIINMLMSEINVIRTAIITGRFGDVSTDITTGSYHERQEGENKRKLDEVKEYLKTT